MLLKDEIIPLTWWNKTPNFGDLLSPYLVKKLTSKEVKLIPLKPGYKRNLIKKQLTKNTFSYLAIGSIISRTTNKSIIWGSGAFGTEDLKSINKNSTYVAVRGPLTRNLLRIHGVKDVPKVYGDPALLIPNVYNPKLEKKYKLGIILRWSEHEWNNTNFDPSIKKIYLGTDDIEGTLNDIISCEKILSSSLHGIILADAYGIPSAWLESNTPKGFEFKFYDYFLSVHKVQTPQNFNFLEDEMTLQKINNQVHFDDRKINFDSKALLNSCPFISKDTAEEVFKI